MAAWRQARGVVGVIVRGLGRFNSRHPWSHNDHFHGWILRHLPPRRVTALEVGCGRGGLAVKLATRFDRVLAIDVDAEMTEHTRAVCTGLSNVATRNLGFDEIGAAGREGFDLVTTISVLHHLELAPALRHIERLLAPGGRVLVVGMARPQTRTDLAWDEASGLLNPFMGLLLHPRANRDLLPPPAFPVRDPEITLDETRRMAERLMPGARLRRHLFFRYTLEWTKPRVIPPIRPAVLP